MSAEDIAVAGTKALRFYMPLRLVSTANVREHFHAKARRAAEHTGLAEAFANSHGIKRLAASSPGGLKVTIVRVGPKDLDDDNLATSGKHVRDGIAKAAGVDDGKPWWTWAYGQRRHRESDDYSGPYGVEVTVVARGRVNDE